MTNQTTNLATTADELRDALYANWSSESVTEVTLRKGRHTRTAVLYPCHKHDCWLFKAMSPSGNRDLAGRFDLRKGVPSELVDGWQVVKA